MKMIDNVSKTILYGKLLHTSEKHNSVNSVALSNFYLHQLNSKMYHEYFTSIIRKET